MTVLVGLCLYLYVINPSSLLSLWTMAFSSCVSETLIGKEPALQGSCCLPGLLCNPLSTALFLFSTLVPAN